jgi:lipoprotein-anchoring transpeptidase ErfK/SrfK
MKSEEPVQSGIGMPGGPENPIGARAFYLWQGNKDTLYRIHGTNEPWTVSQNVSSGCIRLTNDDIARSLQPHPSRYEGSCSGYCV